jgi:hypothetical protein
MDQDKNLKARHDAGKNCDGKETRYSLPPARDLLTALIVLLVFGAVLLLADLLLALILLQKGDRLPVTARLAAITTPLLPIGMLLTGAVNSALRLAEIKAPAVVIFVMWALLLTMRALIVTYFARSPRLPILLAAGVPTFMMILTMVPG